ncbi:urea transporter [Pseudomonas oligotrophica]|uniref:urea transporter n=1 Tax=Pseudomonas oligotrophica TaxID=2912055 RepID=UPI001F3C968E|nr:urea transporter [Pseudomonas oligotrophica]MCF7201937.1 urea transporter [Pseudomonas oligotrophica]
MSGLLRSWLHGLSQTFLQAHAGCGLLVLLAVALGAPALLVGVLPGVVVATCWAGMRGAAPVDIALGLYGYNAALLGGLAVLVLGLTPVGLALALLGAVASCPLQAGLLHALRSRRWPPGFTLPFILLGWALLALAGGAAPAVAAPASLAELPLGVLRGIAQVILLDNAASGACLLLGVALADRRAALWLALGSTTGLLAGLGFDLAGAANGLHGFNPALAALAASQVHRGLWPLLAAVLAAPLALAAHWLGVPLLTLPFILACWALRGLVRPGDAQPQVARGS